MPQRRSGCGKVIPGKGRSRISTAEGWPRIRACPPLTSHRSPTLHVELPCTLAEMPRPSDPLHLSITLAAFRSE